MKSKENTNLNETNDTDTTPNTLPANNTHRLIFAHLNIDSMRNKFPALQTIIQNNIDILVLTESKLNNSFSTAISTLQGYHAPIRLDRNIHGGGIIIYIRANIPHRTLGKLTSNTDNEGIFIELFLRKEKWPLYGGYNPGRARTSQYIKNVEDTLNKYINKYDNIIKMGDINCDFIIKGNKLFCEAFNLTNIVNEPTCYKNPLYPTHIDVILTNKSKQFQYTTTIETGLSDYHKMVSRCLKSYLTKLPPRVIYYSNYKQYDETRFRNDVSCELNSNKNKNDVNYEEVKSNIMTQLEEQRAPMKKRFYMQITRHSVKR